MLKDEKLLATAILEYLKFLYSPAEDESNQEPVKISQILNFAARVEHSLSLIFLWWIA